MKVLVDVGFLNGLCKTNDIKISVLCERIGMSPSIVSRWKAGREPKVWQLVKLSRFFNKSIDHFIIVDEEG
jgi:hypothetical protein